MEIKEIKSATIDKETKVATFQLEVEEKLTNEEIQKIFAMYMGCEYVAPDELPLPVTWKTLYYLVKHKVPKVNRQLLLMPLSKISDEEAIEVAKIYTGCKGFFYKGVDTWGAHLLVNNDGVNFFLFKDLSGSYGVESADYFNKDFVVSYLISKSYAVPLYFTPNHWANGKTAIELDIAIDKTLK